MIVQASQVTRRDEAYAGSMAARGEAYIVGDPFVSSVPQERGASSSPSDATVAIAAQTLGGFTLQPVIGRQSSSDVLAFLLRIPLCVLRILAAYMAAANRWKRVYTDHPHDPRLAQSLSTRLASLKQDRDKNIQRVWNAYRDGKKIGNYAGLRTLCRDIPLKLTWEPTIKDKGDFFEYSEEYERRTDLIQRVWDSLWKCLHSQEVHDSLIDKNLSPEERALLDLLADPHTQQFEVRYADIFLPGLPTPVPVGRMTTDDVVEINTRPGAKPQLRQPFGGFGAPRLSPAEEVTRVGTVILHELMHRASGESNVTGIAKSGQRPAIDEGSAFDDTFSVKALHILNLLGTHCKELDSLK